MLASRPQQRRSASSEQLRRSQAPWRSVAAPAEAASVGLIPIESPRMRRSEPLDREMVELAAESSEDLATAGDDLCVLIPRWVLFAQAALIAIVAVGGFAAGVFVGRESRSPETQPLATHAQRPTHRRPRHR